MLRWCVLTSFSKEIIRKFGQYFKCSFQSFAGFPQHDFISAAKNPNNLALDREFLWQPDCLAIA